MLAICRYLGLLLLVASGGATVDIPISYDNIIQLENVASDSRLFSTSGMNWGGSSGQQVVTAVPRKSESIDIDDTYWQVQALVDTKQHNAFFSNSNANLTGVSFLSGKALGESVKCGSTVRLTHVESRRNLHSHNVPTMLGKGGFEVSAFGNHGQGDGGDYFTVECSTGTWLEGKPVQLKHVDMKGYLYCDSSKGKYTNRNCPGCAIVGHTEVCISPKSSDRKSIEWRAVNVLSLSLEDHDLMDDDDVEVMRDEL